MIPSKEYLEQISKKLDTFNKINGVDPNPKNNFLNDSFDPLDLIGKSAAVYTEKKEFGSINLSPDPLFTDHNKY